MEQEAKKLEMAHEEIRRLADELQGKEKEQSKLGKLWSQMNVSKHVLSVMLFTQGEPECIERKVF